VQLRRPLSGPAATSSNEPVLAFSDGPLLQMVADSSGSVSTGRPCATCGCKGGTELTFVFEWLLRRLAVIRPLAL